jgi:hypothetical protein
MNATDAASLRQRAERRLSDRQREGENGNIPTAFSRRHQPDVATEPIILWPVGKRRQVYGLRSCVWRGSERDSGLQMDQHRQGPVAGNLRFEK